MIEILNFFASYLFNALWQIVIIGIVAWSAVGILSRFGAALEHRIWVWSLGLSVVVPLLATAHAFYPTWSPAGAVLLALHRSTAPLTTVQASRSGEVVAGLPILFIGLCLYVFLLFIRAFRLGRHICAIRILIRSGEPVALSSVKSAAWQEISQRMGGRPIALLSSRRVVVPVTISMPKPVIVLPQAFAFEATLDAFRAALAHECAHILRNDFQKNLIYEAMSTILVFHPLAGLIKKQIGRTREMICDAMVVRSLMDWQRYALALLQIATEVQLPGKSVYSPAMGVVDPTDIERRIFMLRRNRQATGHAPGRWIVVSAAVFLAGASLLASAWTLPVAVRQDSSTSSRPLVHDAALACTYWDTEGRVGPKMRAYDGTCARDRGAAGFVCLLNRNPRLQQPQIACESKVLKAESAQSQ